MATTLTTPLVDLHDAGFKCALPRLSLNRSGVLVLQAAIEKAEQTGENEVTILVLSPAGRQIPLVVQRLEEITPADARALVQLQTN